MVEFIFEVVYRGTVKIMFKDNKHFRYIIHGRHKNKKFRVTQRILNQHSHFLLGVTETYSFMMTKEKYKLGDRIW